MQLFAAQYQPAQQTTRSLRASQYKPSKRKRDEEVLSDEDDAKSAPVSSYAESYASIDSTAPAEAAQLRVAGLEDEAEIPPTPFPHAPAKTSSSHVTYAQVQKSLAELDPPLFAVNATSKSRPVGRESEAPALRQTHLSVLTTIMHRCLLEGDFPRAGRAWGMILRSQIAGTPVDPRNHGRWGIGAELLLHRNTQGGQSNAGSVFTEEGFELAREYYERLIVQHPHRKHQPRALDDLTFYPAMFSLWVYEVCEKSKRARKQHGEDNRHSTSGSAMDEDTTMAEDDRAHMSAIIAEELQQARAIASRLDQLVLSPPFDKHPDLLQLRGMVGLWIGDLILRNDGKGGFDDYNQVPNYDEDDPDESTSDKLQRFLQSRAEFRKALEYLGRAQTNGRKLDDAVDGADAKIIDLSKRIANLETG